MPLPHRKRVVILGLLALGLLAVIYSNLVVEAQSRKTFDEISNVPTNTVGLVLGCKRHLGGGYENPFFRYRVEAAGRLFLAGKVQYLLVSGDNHRPGYDEPSDMKAALLEQGIPADRIVSDYAGFSTLDSVVRAKEVFRQPSFTVISQRFHNERAIFIARAHGIEAVGYNARDVRLRWALKTYLRELASRAKAVWDVRIVHRRPKFLGEPVRIGA